MIKAFTDEIQNAFSSKIVTKDGQKIDVNTTADIRVVNDIDEVKDNEHLIEIVNPDQMPSEEHKGSADYYGKHILLNSDKVTDMMTYSSFWGAYENNKTVPHELGHTGGLIHPFESPNVFNKLFGYDYLQARQLNQDYKNDQSNLMNYGRSYLKQSVSPSQFYILVANYLLGNLNKNNINRKDVESRENFIEVK